MEIKQYDGFGNLDQYIEIEESMGEVMVTIGDHESISMIELTEDQAKQLIAGLQDLVEGL